MNIVALFNQAKGIARAVGHLVVEHLPEIMTGLGTVSMVVGTVVACNETLKAGDIVEQHEPMKENIERAHENGTTANGEEYSEEDYKKDLTIYRVKVGKELVKNYLPAIILELTGAGLVIGGSILFRHRMVGVMTAMTGVLGEFAAYRNNVIADQGADADLKYLYGTQPGEDPVQILDENGMPIQTEGVLPTAKNAPKPTGDDSMARKVLFCEQSSRHWCANPTYNFNKIMAVQREIQGWLDMGHRKFVPLNEALTMLGMEKLCSYAGSNIGWKAAKGTEPHTVVDFGVYSLHDFITNNFAKATGDVYLTFNCRDWAGDCLPKDILSGM